MKLGCHVPRLRGHARNKAEAASHAHASVEHGTHSKPKTAAMPNHRFMKWLRFHAIVCCLALIAAGCDRSPKPNMTVFSGKTMGTYFTVKVVDPPRDVEPQAIEQDITEQLDIVDSQMSTYREDSELSRFNRFDKTEWFPVSEHTYVVIARAQEIGKLTGGALDVTVGPLVDLWHFGPEKGQGIPDDERIAEALDMLGQDEILFRPEPVAIRKERPEIRVDLSAVAKGYAVDLVAWSLLQQGIQNFLVDIGGEVRARGVNQSGMPWRLGVETPISEGRAIQTTVPLTDASMATSGDYRNFFELDGTRYSHIIDPRTGRPAAHRTASVSVIHDSCARADALATALLVLGEEEGYSLAVEQNLPVLFIIREDDGFAERPTPAFEALGK